MVVGQLCECTKFSFSYCSFWECNPQTDILFKTNIVDATIWVLLCAEKNLRCLDFDAFLPAFKFALFQPCCIPLYLHPLCSQRIWDEDSYRCNIFRISVKFFLIYNFFLFLALHQIWDEDSYFCNIFIMLFILHSTLLLFFIFRCH